ncbi:MAG: 3D domain-containing protein [Phycisphaerales bacterium]|nr:3D domain-containing protein [Phycisphaerales bacterium]
MDAQIRSSAAPARSWSRSNIRRDATHAALFLGAAAVTVASAIAAKEMGSSGVALVEVERVAIPSHEARVEPGALVLASVPMRVEPASYVEPAPEAITEPAPAEASPRIVEDQDVRWFNGRPVRPARTIMMTVTAYSPDAQSCGEFADGITATLHSVTTNDMKLVAADPRVLPYGSMLTVPGYDDAQIVPVLDCGGAIKGNRLDLMFPTHESALKWGRRTIPVTVWAYADGKPADNPRALR